MKIPLHLTIIIALLIFCTILAIYMEIILRTSIIYTHVFYIPIVLAGLWYRGAAIATALYLGSVHVITQYQATRLIEMSVFIRAASFVIVALIVITIISHLQRADRLMLDYVSSYLKRVTPVHMRLGGTFDGIRIILGLNLDLDRMRNTGDVDGLIRTLSHQNPELRYQAAKALGRLRDIRSVKALLTALQDTDNGVKWRAGEALGFIGQPAIDALVKAVQHDDDEVRWRATLALGETRDPSALPILIRILGDKDPYIQDRAVIAFEGFGERAIEPLHSAMNNEDLTIRKGAARALGYLANPSAVGILIEKFGSQDTMMQAIVEQALHETAERVIGPLGILLRDNNPTIRKGAARALGVLHSPKAMMILQRAALDPDPAVRIAIEESLVRLSSTEHHLAGRV